MCSHVHRTSLKIVLKSAASARLAAYQAVLPALRPKPLPQRRTALPRAPIEKAFSVAVPRQFSHSHKLSTPGAMMPDCTIFSALQATRLTQPLLKKGCG